jgi:hypothetical protein
MDMAARNLHKKETYQFVDMVAEGVACGRGLVHHAAEKPSHGVIPSVKSNSPNKLTVYSTNN